MTDHNDSRPPRSTVRPRIWRPRWVIPLACVTAIACGGQGSEPAAPSSAPATSAEATPPETTEAAATTPAPTYEVHEWGLIDVHGSSYELAAGAGDPQPAAPVVAPDPAPMRPTMRPTPGGTIGGTPAHPMVGRRKPVLYFHRDGSGPLAVTVSVSGAGRIAEHWPPAEITSNGVTWRDVVVGEQSTDCRGLTYPSRDSVQCQHAPGGYCELADLGDYEAEDGACLGFGGGTWDHLFYRGTGEGPMLPVTVSRNGDAITVRNTATDAPVVAAYYVRRGASGQPVSAARLSLVGGEPAVFGAVSPDGAAEARAQLAASLREGLTNAEAEAFERAWFSELFEAGRTGGAPVVRDAVIYVLPEPHVATFSRLAFTPAPAAVRRVFWVRVDVTPVP